MKTKHLKTTVFLCVILGLTGLIPATAQDNLSRYIHEGMRSNLVLQQKQISLKQAEQSLQIARSYFLPSINILGDYTSGKGGRNIAFPIGDMLNPVYASLNQLTQSDVFPQVENVSEDFFPYNFYDARVRTSIPIINTDLHINRTIKGQQILLKEYEVEAYKRQLILEIKTAYYSHLSALEAVKIYESALALVNQNIRVNESLLRNGKSLPANLLRVKSEAENVKADLNDAIAKAGNSRKYFNFLLNRSLDTDIDVDTNFQTTPDLPDSDVTTQQREELAMLKTVREINASSLQLYKLSRLPKVNAFMDLGSQATDWQFNDRSRYYLVGVQLSLPIFQGFRNNIQIRQTRFEIERSELDLKNTTLQLQVSAEMAANNLHATKQNFVAAQEQLRSAKSYFNLIEKGYQQGINSQIEYIDARNQYTQAELKVNLRQFEMLTAAAQLERETSSYNLNK